MTDKNHLLHEIETLPVEYIDEVIDFVGYLKAKKLSNIPDTALASEAALAKGWDSVEEDAAWKGL